MCNPGLLIIGQHLFVPAFEKNSHFRIDWFVLKDPTCRIFEAGHQSLGHVNFSLVLNLVPRLTQAQSAQAVA